MSGLEADLWEVPTSWTWATMGDAAEVVGGGTPATSNPDNFGGSIPWITPADMSTHVGKVISNGARSISEKGLESSGARWLPKGSVLFSSRAPIGYVAIAARPVTTNQGFKTFVPEDGISSDFVYHWLTSAKPLAEKLASGTTFLEISGAKSALIPFPIAPVAEQTRIVEKLEELLSDLDAGLAELKAAQKKLARYRQSLLKAAVEGVLTAEWRDERARPGEATESGAQLLARILTERRARWEAKQLAKFKAQGNLAPKAWKDKYPQPIQPDTTKLPALPKGWVWAAVDQLSPDDLANGRSVPSADIGAKVLRLTAVKSGRIDLREFKIGEWTEEAAAPFSVTDGDLLIVRGNGSLNLVGRAGLVANVADMVAYPDTLIRLRVLTSVVRPAWVGLMWESAMTRKHVEGRARTSAGIYKISQPDIVSVVIPIPPLREQDQMLSVFDQANDELSAVLATLEQACKQSLVQRKNILKAAFSGQLVQQDPNDEPASMLLERIRAERSAQENGKKTKSKKAHL